MKPGLLALTVSGSWEVHLVGNGEAYKPHLLTSTRPRFDLHLRHKEKLPIRHSIHSALTVFPMATHHLAHWACSLKYSDLPKEVVRSAVESLYNWAGCAIGGSDHPAVSIAVCATNLGLPNVGGD